MDTGDVLAALVEGATAAAHALSLPAEAYGNDAQLEVMWAMKAYNHAEVYYNVTSLARFQSSVLKSADAKEKWRPFCNQFEGVVEDFNYGTSLCLDCQKDYTEVNTIFVTLSNQIHRRYHRTLQRQKGKGYACVLQ
uniref:Polysaccharide biosynthesis domain containing 1 n=1 Tax=Sinocyclocheilus grahami TaxID=75366 RepID=A0A672K7Y5_SINGR